jgi:hypothetical protein
MSPIPLEYTLTGSTQHVLKTYYSRIIMEGDTIQDGSKAQHAKESFLFHHFRYLLGLCMLNSSPCIRTPSSFQSDGTF